MLSSKRYPRLNVGPELAAMLTWRPTRATEENRHAPPQVTPIDDDNIIQFYKLTFFSQLCLAPVTISFRFSSRMTLPNLNTSVTFKLKARYCNSVKIPPWTCDMNKAKEIKFMRIILCCLLSLTLNQLKTANVTVEVSSMLTCLWYFNLDSCSPYSKGLLFSPHCNVPHLILSLSHF